MPVENPLLSKINAETPEYEPKWNLLKKLDSEWIGYVNGTNGFYYKWLAKAVSVLKPQNILELGTYTGTSTIMMYGEMGQDATLTSVDTVRDHRFIPDIMREDCRVRFVIGNDLDLSVYGDTAPQNVDFLFVDTEHSARQATAEWNLYRHKLVTNALVAFDDIKLNDMPQFWEKLPEPKFDLSKLCHYSGFGVILYSQPTG